MPVDFLGVATIIGLLLTVVGLIYAGIQLRESKRIARGDFLLRLDEMFRQHNEVHTRLRPRGTWADGTSGPVTAEDWIMVERYMGLFERIKILVDDRIVDIGTVYRLYGYRVFNITANDKIRIGKRLLKPKAWKKLSPEERNSHGWKDFIELWHALEDRRKSMRPGSSHASE